MNISSYNPYPDLSAYPVPVSSKTATTRASDAELEARNRLPAREPVSEQERERNRGSAESARAQRSQAVTEADRIRGRLATDDTLHASAQRALSAYQSVEVQDQREAVTRTLGIDLYV